MKVKYNELDNHYNVTATPNFLEELAMSEFGAYEDGDEDATNLVEAIIKASARENLQSRGKCRAKEMTVTIKASTAEYLMHPNGLEFHIMKWREWAGMGDFSANAYVRSGKALQKHLEAAIKEVLRHG